MSDGRVAVFGVDRQRRIKVYHLRRDKAGSGMTMCGRLFDSTCWAKDAHRGRLRRCWNCDKAVKR